MILENLGGYRLVRKLGEGPRAEVFLGHPQLRPGEEPTPVALKLFRDGTSQESIIAEIEALSRAAGEHSLELRDLCSAPDGAPALILERLPGGSLGRLLRERATLRAGEAITILAPLAETLGRLWSAGVVHGGVRLDAVLFDGDGAPVLSGFGRATLIAVGQPLARLELEPGVSSDTRSLAALCRTVLERVGSERSLALCQWLDSSTALEADGWLANLGERLFELGSPEAIDFTADAPERDRLPGRVLTAAPVVEATDPRVGVFAAVALPEWTDAILARLRTALRAVRPRVWVMAGAVGLALLTALVLVPPNGSDATATPTALPAASAESSPAAAGPVNGDDPVLAVAALLDARERCIRDLSILCLDAVDQDGSAALARDQALIRELQGGAESPEPITVVQEEIVVVERLGDSVLLSLGDVADSEPASVLLMKGEAGWRIRDYLES